MTSDMALLSAAQGKVLLDLARKTLNDWFGRGGEAASGPPPATVTDPALQASCGTFVTLKIGGRLRGCIGTLTGREPLVQGVQTQALNAAFHDPRFRPLTGSELAKVTIEISVLTKPKVLAFKDADDLILKLRPNVDGVTIRQGEYSATFLPQVWEQLPHPQDFLSQLCLKAGLDGDAWRKSGLTVETYQVQYFGE